ncbi:MAG: tRNA (guanosine(37)-N1)-methyltransferase TrmD [Deltaproteobacteria bacterium]|nr:tRNA (guanosine(37)-N1)-methyltransferase TrmD [Deltaproteobacteria bacterium]MBW2414592.1 tRNA (guanosine(37)-N1)-methyltransferase TrmD [Deltaproteobacteria bacterium]
MAATPRIDILTLFPDLVEPFLDGALVGAARRKGLLDIRVTDIRDFSTDRHRSVDDAPYGGGDGMVLKCEPVVAAVEEVAGGDAQVLAMSPRGRPLDQARVVELSGAKQIVLLCGRYAGFDERILQETGAEEVSIGDYVLSGGELAALAVTEAVARLVPGVLGNPESPVRDSFSSPKGSAPARAGILEHPVYTRPPVFRGRAVPEVLLSGNHAEIERYRRAEALRITRDRRPDLLENADLGAESDPE